jgi:WD40 repeat protein
MLQCRTSRFESARHLAAVVMATLCLAAASENVSGQEPRLLKGHTDKVADVRWSPDGKRLASASWDKTVKI